jgi:hypothetical protein
MSAQLLTFVTLSTFVVVALLYALVQWLTIRATWGGGVKRYMYALAAILFALGSWYMCRVITKGV